MARITMRSLIGVGSFARDLRAAPGLPSRGRGWVAVEARGNYGGPPPCFV